MATVIDAYRMLTWLLLRGPRDPRGRDSKLFNMAADLLERFGYSPQDSPVLGVGWSIVEKDFGEVVVLVRDSEALVLGPEAGRILGFADAKNFRISGIVAGSIDLTGRNRPSQGGDSLSGGNANSLNGTSGCLVSDVAGDNFILTCAHVVVANNTLVNKLPCGTDVWQPSRADGGGATDIIGKVETYAPIEFGGYTPNEIDAALVRPDTSADAVPGLRLLGSIAGTGHMPFRAALRKNGWKTNITSGNFLFITSHIQRFGKHDALFQDQLGIVWELPDRPFSADGDSGAIAINERNEAVGLIFATSEYCRMSFANPIQRVLNHFGVMPL